MPRDKRINLDFGLESVVFVISVCAAPCRATFLGGDVYSRCGVLVSPSEGRSEVCIVFEAGGLWGAAGLTLLPFLPHRCFTLVHVFFSLWCVFLLVRSRIYGLLPRINEYNKPLNATKWPLVAWFNKKKEKKKKRRKRKNEMKEKEEKRTRRWSDGRLLQTDVGHKRRERVRAAKHRR